MTCCEGMVIMRVEGEIPTETELKQMVAEVDQVGDENEINWNWNVPVIQIVRMKMGQSNWMSFYQWWPRGLKLHGKLNKSLKFSTKILTGKLTKLQFQFL